MNTTELTGTLNRSEIERLKFPQPHLAIVPAWEVKAKEAAACQLAREALAQLDQAYEVWSDREDFQLGVRFEGGAIAEIVEI